MGLDIWFAEDIRNALLAANEGSAQTAAVIAEVYDACNHLPRRVNLTCTQCENEADYMIEFDVLTTIVWAYREGYKAALITLALAFGLSLDIVGGEPPRIAGALPVSTPPPGCDETSMSPIGDCTTEGEE